MSISDITKWIQAFVFFISPAVLVCILCAISNIHIGFAALIIFLVYFHKTNIVIGEKDE